MYRKTANKIGALLTLLMLFSSFFTLPVKAADNSVEKAISDTAAYLYQTVKEPQVGSVGGEWAIIGLARSGYKIPDQYYQNYYDTVQKYVKDCNGVLHQKKYTEYSRLIVALTSIGKDPSNVAGYNLLTPLGDYEKTIWQGLNGPVWALIALDSGNYEMPVNHDAKTQATRNMYVDRILSCQLADGGFSLFGGTVSAANDDMKADPDITGMALQALAKYRNRDDVAKVIDESLACLSKMQDSSGGYASWGTTNSESVSQVIVALGELSIPVDDRRFVKNGHTLLDNLLTYYTAGKGFQHTANGSGVNQMATEQAFYALVSAQRNMKGESSLYRMSNALSIPEAEISGPAPGEGLEDKNINITVSPVSNPGVTYSDISNSANKRAIEALAARAIISGYDGGTFRPDDPMSRAEFATVIVKAFGLTPTSTGIFTDVASSGWYTPYVGAANTYGIVTGRSANIFDPDGTITRQEAAVMAAKGAQLCGMDTQMDTAAIRDVLAQFSDYVHVAEWARESVAFCYKSGILDPSALEVQPDTAIKRGEIAQMLFNLLSKANLL